MITNKPSTTPAAKSGKRSLLGLLFVPRMGSSVSPLRDTTRIFLHLLAGVFSIYGLVPKDYPGLRDESAPMKLSDIISTAWSRIEFTREGLPRALMFFAVTAIMAFSAVMCVIALLGIVSAMMAGHAHAEIANASNFTADSNDLAQSWLNYLFIGPSNGAAASYPIFSDSFGDTMAQMQDPFAGSVSLQKALITALGLYSDAILIVAAFILFYHLTAMIVETAHHGVPMGKRASQIWAPIRLVVAIGLLVPINSGLNCGQFIVIKMAELGSAFASHVWDSFLDTLVSYNSKPVEPKGPIVQLAALDLIKMEACQLSWNRHVDDASTQLGDFSSVEMQMTSQPFMDGNIPGTKYSYSSNSLADVDVCGWYFIPSGGANAMANAAAGKQQQAIVDSHGEILKAANKMYDILKSEAPDGATPSQGTTTPQMDGSFTAAAAEYQSNISTAMASLAQSQKTDMQSALNTLKPYGWVMAGATLNTIDRMQGGLVNASADSVPTMHPPDKIASDSDRPGGVMGWLHYFMGSNGSKAWDIRKNVASDMNSFDQYMKTSIESSKTTNTKTAQCAAMVGLNASSDSAGAGKLTSAVNYVFGLVDYIASMNGVWQAGSGTSCGDQGPNASNNTTFSLGIQFNGTDPFAQMAYLGHANLNVAITLMSYAMGSSIGGGILSGFGAMGGVAGGIAGGLGGIISGAGSLISFMALIFFVSGFTLAYLVPLMPFLRFFFSVLSWVAAIIEAVVAMPLVALAHLNPEGEGLPGQSARSAYYFLFNLALRPVLMIFGFICGYIIFLIAISFLNYAYAIAVAGAGGTAFGHAAMSHIIYSVLYVAIVYVCANHSFALIDHLPSHAMQWMGGQAQAMPQMGDAGKIETVASAISGYGGNQLIGNMQGFAGALGNGVGGIPKGIIAKRNENKKDDKMAQIFGKSPDGGGAGAKQLDNPSKGGGGGGEKSAANADDSSGEGTTLLGGSTDHKDHGPAQDSHFAQAEDGDKAIQLPDTKKAEKSASESNQKLLPSPKDA